MTTRSVAHVDYYSTANCRTKIPEVFRGIFGIFTVLTSLYLRIYLISRLLAQPLTMLCGILVGKHCYKDFRSFKWPLFDVYFPTMSV